MGVEKFNPETHTGPITRNRIAGLEDLPCVKDIDVLETHEHLVLEVKYSVTPTWDVQKQVLNYMIDQKYTAVASQSATGYIHRYEFRFWNELRDRLQ